jgi:hypothetical protein
MKTRKTLLTLIALLLLISTALTSCKPSQEVITEPDMGAVTAPDEQTTPEPEQHTPELDYETVKFAQARTYNFEYTIIDDWDTGFTAEVRIISKMPIKVSGWMLHFDGDFTITQVNNAHLGTGTNPLRDSNHEILRALSTKYINPYSSVSFSFTADKESGTIPVLEEFMLRTYRPDESPTEHENIPEQEYTGDSSKFIIYQDGDSLNYVSNDLILAQESNEGHSITWLSNFEEIISSEGKVTRPTGGFFTVELIAVLQNGDSMQKKSFTVKVAPLNNPPKQKMTIDLLEEILNFLESINAGGEMPEVFVGGEMPEITYNDEGFVTKIEDGITTGEPKSNISPFPVFVVEDAKILINNYLELFGFDEGADILLSNFSPERGTFNFNVDGTQIEVRTDVGTGRVVSIAVDA